MTIEWTSTLTSAVGDFKKNATEVAGNYVFEMAGAGNAFTQGTQDIAGKVDQNYTINMSSMGPAFAEAVSTEEFEQTCGEALAKNSELLFKTTGTTLPAKESGMGICH